MMAATLSEQDSPAPHIHRQQFSLPQLPTSSVTIYPARATVVRDIKGIILKPGRNEIILHQLTPRADENSIKVSGRLTEGKILLIADMTVDLVKPPAPGGAEENGERDKVVSWEPDSDNDEVEEEPTVSDNDTPTLKELSGKIQDLKSKLKDRREKAESCERQLAYLERWGTTLTDKELSKGSLGDRSTSSVEQFLNTYSVRRSDLMAQRAGCVVELEVWEKFLAKLEKEKQKLSTRVLRKKLKAKEERIRKKEEELERLREEGKVDKDAKAPEKWYRVRVWIDREESDDGEDSSKVTCDVEGELELKYTVSDAGWASRYDIVISSAGDADSATDIANPKAGKVTAHLTYHAHFQNRTYETWKDALITLSTSQTVFTGLQDGAPTLEPWRIRLTSIAAAAGHYKNRYGHGGHGEGDSAAAILKNRTYGGLYSSQEKAGIDKEKKEERKIVQPMQQQYRRSAWKAPGGLVMGTSKGVKRYSSAPSATTESINRYGIFDSPGYGGGGVRTEVDDGESSESEDEAASMAETLTRTLTLSSTHQPAQPPAPRPNFVTQGLTSSYSLPHRMTIPSTHGSVGDLETSTSAVRRHTILTMALSQIQLSYASTPKLRAAAYLKARILNDSSTTLRKGLVGVTLDGTFVGSTPLPRTIYPGGIFNLPLGIDESVTVTYAKPSIRRNAQKNAAGGGLFGSSMISWGKGQQEMMATYGRSTVIRNNRLDRGAIELMVCDQVPVSEDAKLVVTVTYPRGLKPPPPLLAPGAKNAKAIQEEPEMGEGDEGGGEGSSMRMGHPVPTGTGVYVEGFSAIMAQEEVPKPVVVQPASPQKLPVPPGSTSAPSDDDSISYQSTGKTKRKSLFSNIGRSSTVKHSGAPPPPPLQPQVQPQPKQQEFQPFWKSAIVKEEKWGSAVAAMRRNGEVVWKVKLNPGMGVRLGLEYDAKVPAGEGIAGL